MIPLSPTIASALNDQFNLERASEAVYLAAAAAADSGTIALPGFAKFLGHSAHDERKHARKFSDYITKRGGHAVHAAVPEADDVMPSDPLGFARAAVARAQAQEALVTMSIDELCDLADGEGDTATCIFLQWFVMEQVDSEKELQDLAIRLAAVDCSAALQVIDAELLND